jgi:hypothetical protein
VTHSLSPLIREARILYFKWAMREMGPLHADLPEAVHRLHELVSERPPTKPRSRCERTAGCAQDEACPDHGCEGHPGLYQRDGGHEFRAGVVWPIETKRGARA